MSHTVKEQLRRIFKKKPPVIVDTTTCLDFIAKHAAHLTGKIVIDYADHRTGKLRWQLMEEKAYVDHLQSAHIRIHACVTTDMIWIGIGRYCTTATGLHAAAARIHTTYATTKTPDDTQVADETIDIAHIFDIRAACAGKTADHARMSAPTVLTALPFTEGLSASARDVFTGQLQTGYLAFVESLKKNSAPAWYSALQAGNISVPEYR